MSTAGRADFRVDLEGLRGVAVLAVIAYHAAPSLCPGGFIGVDVFFVISGFLIGRITARQAEAGSFSPLDFYARRLRRLAPALVAVLLGTLALGWFYLLPHEFVALGKHVSAGVASLNNFALRFEAGYFDTSSLEKPLLHLWSLAVEAQFYIVWPLLLLIASRRVLVLTVGLVVVASFCSCLVRLETNPVAAFFLPHYRMWELGAGVLLALTLGKSPAAPRLTSLLLSVAGIAALVAAYICFDGAMPYPGAAALVPVLATVALIAAGPGALVNRLLLATQPLRGVGVVSYSAYLWHWPILSFAHVLQMEGDWRTTVGVLCLTAALAVLTYRFIEQPARRIRSPLATSALAATTACVGLAGLGVWSSIVLPRLSSQWFIDASAATKDWEWPPALERDRSLGDLKVYRTGQGPGAVLFAGDSHMQHYWPRVHQLVARGRSSAPPVVFATREGCPPIRGLDYRGRPDCASLMSRALDIAGRDDVATVVFSAGWHIYFTNPQMEMRNAGIAGALPGREAAMRQLSDDMRSLVAKGKTVYLVLGSPTGMPPTGSLRRTVSGEITSHRVNVPLADVEQSQGATRRGLMEAAAAAGAITIDPVRNSLR